MIVIHSTIPFAADSIEDARQHVRDLVEASRREDGTVRYRAMADVEDPTTVRFFEQYEDEDAWRAHTESDHYTAFVSALPDLVDGAMETINFVEVDDPHVHEFGVDELAEGD
ncbi:MAG: putative quinol monooxygenase [Halobacterium sp.]